MIELRILGPLSVTGCDSGDDTTVLRQPKRLAILVRIALAGRANFARRDALLAMFWPEQDEERGRHALRQALHSIRSAFKQPVIDRRGDDELALDGTVIRCDAAEFERLIAAGQLAEALELYRGDVLPGFFLDDAPEFERWLEDTRARLRHTASTAATRLAAMHGERGELELATRYALGAHELSPDDEVVFRHYLTLLDRSGNRAAAVQAYERFAKRLLSELEVAPSAETQALARSLRSSATETTVVSHVDAPVSVRSIAVAPAVSDAAHEPVAPTATSRVRPSRVMASVAAIAVLAAVVALVARPRDSANTSNVPLTVATTPMAQRLYDEGMRASASSDRQAAERLMRAAVEEDSMFGLAMIRLGHLLGVGGAHAEGQRMQTAALAIANRQSDHDRLLITTLFADHFGDPRLRAYAETLAIRYPADLEGQLLVAQGRRDAGEYLRAVEPLQHVLAGGWNSSGAPTQCLACDASRTLIEVYESADSLRAAERSAREWTQAQPANPAAWNTLSYQLAIQGRYADAIAASRKAGDLSRADDADDALNEILLRAGDFETLDHILSVRQASSNRERAEGAEFLRWRLLREQGRYTEALAFAESHRESLGTLRIQSLTDIGRHGDAATLWDSLMSSVHVGPEPAPSAANARAGYRIRYIDALAELHDAARMQREIAVLTSDVRLSGLKRVQLLIPHAEGMLLLARGDSAAGCAKLREAVISATNGYVKTYLAIGRACLAAHRPNDAIPALRSIVRGPLGASGTFATFTEAHDLLARAFDAIGQRDSATVHLQRVASAWAFGDGEKQLRAAEATRLLGAPTR